MTDFEPLEPKVHCFECGERVKVFPASILVGENYLEHVLIVKELWDQAQRITTSFRYDRVRLIEELEEFARQIEATIKAEKQVQKNE